MRLHVTYPKGFLSSYISQAAITYGDALVGPEEADAVILSGWRYSDAAQSLIDAIQTLGRMRPDAFVVSVGSHVELWRPETIPLRWAEYAKAKRALKERVSALRPGRAIHCRLTQLVGPGMTRGTLALDAASVVDGKSERVQLDSAGTARIAPTNVEFVGGLLRDIANAGVPLGEPRNLWSVYPMPIGWWLDYWGVPWSPGSAPDGPDVPKGDLRSGRTDVTRGLLAGVFPRYPETQEIV